MGITITLTFWVFTTTRCFCVIHSSFICFLKELFEVGLFAFYIWRSWGHEFPCGGQSTVRMRAIWLGELVLTSLLEFQSLQSLIQCWLYHLVAMSPSHSGSEEFTLHCVSIFRWWYFHSWVSIGTASSWLSLLVGKEKTAWFLFVAQICATFVSPSPSVFPANY